MERIRQLPNTVIVPLVVLIASIVLALFDPGCLVFVVPLWAATAVYFLYRFFSRHSLARTVARDVGAEAADGDDRTTLASTVEMDGVIALRTKDGSLMIRQRATRNWLLGGLLALFLVGILGIAIYLIVDLVQSGGKTWAELFWGLLVLSSVGGSLVAALRALVRSQQSPLIRVSVDSQAIEIGRGASARQVPFSSLSRVIVEHVGVGGEGSVYQFRIAFTLDDGTGVSLGTVSGKAAAAEARAFTVARMAAEATGASMVVPFE